MHASLLPDLIGSIGVAILLAAFLLSLAGRLASTSIVYLAMNLVGAGLACLSSWLIGFMPFVVLEGTWCLVAAVTLARRFTGLPGSTT